MRIFLASIVILLGANLAVDLMDSDMVELMQERNEQIQRTMDRMWQSAKWHNFLARPPKSTILEEWRGFHFTNVLHFSSMRKIETQMIAAVKGDKNWTKDNTSVIIEDGVSKVYLHGNLIAEVDDESIKLYDGGWQSNTTKSRLNALLSEFGYATERVFQKNYEWFINIFDLSDRTMRVIPFTSGMRLAWEGLIPPLFFSALY